MKKQYIVGLVALVLVVFGLGTWTGILIEKHNTQAALAAKDSAAEYQLIGQAWNIVRDNYVDKTATQPQQLAYGAIAGMVDSLGDTGHSVFLTPDEVRQQNRL